MGDKSEIGWTDATWNPLIGCSRVSEGCDHCYAIGTVHRQMSPQHVGLTIRSEKGTDWNGEVHAVPHLLEKPLHWKHPRRIFVNSLSDVFHPEALKLTHEPTGTPYLVELFAVMVMARQHTFQILTKRPQVARAVLGEPRFRLDVNSALLRRGVSVMPGGFESRWPKHIQIGTSIELNKYAWRADHIRHNQPIYNVPVYDPSPGVTFISAEPLLGPLPSLSLKGIDWLIVGGESGQGARPMHPDWVRDLRDRCAAEGVAFWFKQWGAWTPDPTSKPDPDAMVLSDGRVIKAREQVDYVDTLDAVPMARTSAKLNGNLLDGQLHEAFPS